MDVALTDLRLLADAVLAAALGGVVGWERERKNKGAGFRTMMLVSLASYLFVVVSLAAAAAVPTGEMVRTDPVRAIQSIATGLGFVGAGLVFRDRQENRTRGLTTAAALLAVAPVGVAVAVGHVVLAVGTTLLLVLILSAGDVVEERYIRREP